MMGQTIHTTAAPDEKRGAQALAPKQLLLTARKHWLIVVGTFVLCLAAATVFTQLKTRIYESSATIYFDPRPPRPLGEKVDPVVETTQDYWSRLEYYNTQHWLLSSRAVLEPVAQKLQLDHDAGFVQGKRARTHGVEAIVSLDETVNLLARRVQVVPVKESRLARVSVRDASPERAHDILKAITDEYLQQNESHVASATSEASTWLHKQLSTLKDELEESEKSLHKYKKERDLLSVSLDDQSSMLREEIGQINVALTAAKTKRQHIASRNSQLKQIDDKDPVSLPAQELLQSTVLQNLRAHYLEASKELEGLRGSGRGAKHPDVAAAAAKKEASRQALLDEVSNIKLAVSRDLKAIDSEIAGLQNLYNGARSGALDVNKLEIEYKRLRRTRDTNERLLTLVTERAKESDLAGMLRVNNVRIVEAASMPRSPVSPNLTLNLLGGCVAGLLLGFAFAVTRESMDHSINSVEELRDEVQVSVLGSLPASALTPGSYLRKSRKKFGPQASDSVEFTAHSNPNSEFAEAVRSIRTALLFSSPDEPAKRLLVTSAGPSEGKTTTACNLAITMAQAGKRVLIVDCDLRRPRLHTIFASEVSSGVTEALLPSPPKLTTLIHETKVPRLSFMAAGTLPPNPSEILHSRVFAQLLDRLDAEFDLLVIDSPPLLPVTDGAILASQCDAVALVARSKVTSVHDLKHALRILSTVSAKLCGAILNATTKRSQSGKYYGGYHSAPFMPPQSQKRS